MAYLRKSLRTKCCSINAAKFKSLRSISAAVLERQHQYLKTVFCMRQLYSWQR